MEKTKKQIIGTEVAKGKGKAGRRKVEEDVKVETERPSRAQSTAESTSASERSRSVSLRRRLESRGSSTSSKRRWKDDGESGTEDDERMSEGDDSVRLDACVPAGLRASVMTIVRGDGVNGERSELVCMRDIGARLRKSLFMDGNRVMKGVSETVLNCVSEYEQCLVRLMCENERLKGRLDECKKSESVPVHSVNVNCRSFASVASMKSRVSVPEKTSMSVPMRVSERIYAVVIKPNDVNAKLTSEQGKERVMNEVNKSLNVRVRAVRKTRSGGIAVETVSENEARKMRYSKV